jgi:hypothetical protein
LGEGERTGDSAAAKECPGVSRLARATIRAALAVLALGWWPGAAAVAVDCDRELGQLWQPRELTVEGTRFWLWRVFTIDTDNDGRTDDVGFILKAKGKTDLILRYIKTTGKVSGRRIAALRLADEGDIPRLCFGRITFKKPVKVTREPFTPFKIPDLSRKTAAEPAPPEPSEEPAEWWPEALGASIFLVFGFGSAGVLTRYCRFSPRRGADDRRAGSRRGSGDRREQGAERGGAADQRVDDRRKGDRRREAGRRTKADRRRE